MVDACISTGLAGVEGLLEGWLATPGPTVPDGLIGAGVEPGTLATRSSGVVGEGLAVGSVLGAVFAGGGLVEAGARFASVLGVVAGEVAGFGWFSVRRVVAGFVELFRAPAFRLGCVAVAGVLAGVTGFPAAGVLEPTTGMAGSLVSRKV